MANLIYLTLTGKKQGLISAGCSTFDSIGNLGQTKHRDQIYVYDLVHGITRAQHVQHHPIVIKKPIDKSSPLLGMAISENEELECVFEIYKASSNGIRELYYSIRATKATITDLHVFYPHSVTHNDAQPQESVAFQYHDITWKHHIAKTSGYSFWDDRVY